MLHQSLHLCTCALAPSPALAADMQQPIAQTDKAIQLTTTQSPNHFINDYQIASSTNHPQLHSKLNGKHSRKFALFTVFTETALSYTGKCVS